MHEVHNDCGERVQAIGDIRVLLIDDHQIFREGLRAMLAMEAGIAVSGEAKDGATAYALLDAASPDVALVDLALPGVHGIAVARELKRRAPRCKVLILTAGELPDGAGEAFAAGVAGYVLKTESASTIVGAIRQVAKGESYWANEQPQAKEGVDREHYTLLEGLSRREREIFDLIVIGHSNDSICNTLRISVKTVETHRSSINRKLGVHSTAEVVRFAAKRGLLTSAS